MSRCHVSRFWPQRSIAVSNPFLDIIDVFEEFIVSVLGHKVDLLRIVTVSRFRKFVQRSKLLEFII